MFLQRWSLHKACMDFNSTFKQLAMNFSRYTPVMKQAKPYRRCRAGRQVRERRSWKLHSIPTIVKSNLDRSFRHVNRMNNHWSDDNPSAKYNRRGINLENLRNVIKETKQPHCLKPLKLGNANTQSIKNKIAEFISVIVDNKLDICVVTETWMTELDTAVIAALSINGYNFKHFPRQSQRVGGGTGIMYRDSMKAVLVDGREYKSFEVSEWNVNFNNTNLKIIIVYRPPYSSSHPVSLGTFFDELSTFLERIVLCPEKLIISGDFNIHLDDTSNSDTINFNELLQTFGLLQHVFIPTHASGHTLDPIISRSSNDLTVGTARAIYRISDHDVILCDLHTSKPALSVKQIQFREINNIDVQAFQSDLSASDLLSADWTDLRSLHKCYHDTLGNILNKHAPIKSKVIVARPTVPWFNSDLKALKCSRRKLEKKFLLSGLDSDKKAYRTMRIQYSAMLRKAREIYYTDQINKCSGDKKKLFSFINSLCNEKDDQIIADDHPTILANRFGDFFSKKVQLIRDKIETTDIEFPPAINLPPPTSHLESFTALKEEDVKKIIISASNSSCGLDPISTKLLKSCLDVLAPVICQMVNLSLQNSFVPDEWKTAIVTPIVKKSGLTFDLNNFRPVSNLNFISKITEKAVVNQLLDHCRKNSLLPSNQSAYRQWHSTETALLKVQNDILQAMDKQQVTLLVLLDLSAAFDTIDHKDLLKILSDDFGVVGNASQWFKSYLSSRKQRVKVGSSLSNDFDLQCGVPQGSCLGPILFICYASKLFHVISKHLPKAHGYADDTQLYFSFCPDSQESQDRAITAMENCVRDVRSWMISNKLMINDSKTELMVIGSRQQLSKINIQCIKIGESDIIPVHTVRNLGSWFDNNLSMSTHIGKVCSKAFRSLYKLMQIRKFLCSETTKTLVNAFVISHLDYCNALLYGIPEYQYNRLQKIQNAAARLVTLIPKFNHITPVLIDLHWLPVKFRIHFKILVLVHKALHGKAPTYIVDLLQVKPTTRYSLRSNNTHLLFIPSVKCKTFGGRSFSYAGPTLWNQLPLNLRAISNLDIFKQYLKTFLFKLAFDS